jgi:hypothetical protein
MVGNPRGLAAFSMVVCGPLHFHSDDSEAEDSLGYNDLVNPWRGKPFVVCTKTPQRVQSPAQLCGEACSFMHAVRMSVEYRPRVLCLQLLHKPYPLTAT